ncbi:hypothetical protein FSP39_005638 [Pinctada imbricata]|uniref:Uncharacterized protein n=1 Tax=Pinctada imbricata TaxID=66713 RepID=A0AA88XJC8_PINIB|nr:hypothetical protein FSP39_005638 [Pinctada imbricata]
MADTSDYLRGGAFVVMFLLTGIWDLNTWLISDLVFTFFSGLLIYSNPWWSMDLQTKDVKLDVVHAQLHRLFAAFLMGPLLLWLFRRKSKDPNVIAAMLWSRTVGIMTLLFIMTVGQLTYGHIFTDKHVWFGFLGNILWWLANVVQLIKNKPSISGYQQTRGITLLLHLNLLILTLLSLAFLAFPKMMFKIEGRKADKYHLHTARAVGALIMGSAAMMWIAPCIKERRDVRIIFISQSLMAVLCEASYLILHFSAQLMTKQELYIRMATFIPLLVISLIGIFLSCKTTNSDADSAKIEDKKNS